MEYITISVVLTTIILILFYHFLTNIKPVSPAYSDALTGLPGRCNFLEEAERGYKKSIRSGHPCSIIMLDLDRFKIINDTYGHMAGDQILKEIAACIQEIIRPFDLVARWGGEEFIIFTETNEASAVRLASRIKDKIGGTTFVFQDISIRCTVSGGVASSNEEGIPLKLTIRNADIALYIAKNNGRNRIELYSDKEMIPKIAQSAESGFEGFMLCYQPIYSAWTLRCIGAEALLRWRSPDGEIFMPEYFMPELEKMGLLLNVERWVLNTTCTQCKEWIEQFDDPCFCIHINLSMGLLCGGTLTREIEEAVERAGVTPNNIVLEFSNLLGLSEIYQKNDELSELRHREIRIAADRFGAGQSKLGAFKSLPVDELRLDRSLIKDIEYDETARKLLAGIIHMLKGLDHRVCAMGVETDWQRRFLQTLGVDMIQGHLLGRPMESTNFGNMYRSGKKFYGMYSNSGLSIV